MPDEEQRDKTYSHESSTESKEVSGGAGIMAAGTWRRGEEKGFYDHWPSCTKGKQTRKEERKGMGNWDLAAYW